MELAKLISALFTLYGLIIITNASDDDCSCGGSSPDRIISGQDATVDKFPMLAGIYYRPSPYIDCAATIITDKHVLTAARCFEYTEDTIEDYAILVGEDDINRLLENNVEGDDERLYNIKKITNHPKYDGTSFNNDIAIVEAEEKFKFSKKIGQVCLPFSYVQQKFVGGSVKALGWGITKYNTKNTSNTLQKVDTKVVSTDKCKNLMDDLNEENVLCTFCKKIGPCTHDKGGPILWRNQTSNNWMLIGVINLEGCGRRPTINARVTNYLDFIESSTDYKFCKKTYN